MKNHLHCRKVNLPEDYLELIPLYCTAQLVLRIKTRNQANKRARIPRKRYCFSINRPDRGVRWS